ncbi:MAG: radical SAM protein [Candidatus Aminicenantes bacterium]|nr:radical SAM protein [Candidatus Aminicenantes bacterium]
MAKQSHLYGPVPSRRLGYSLGVDLLPFKTCSMDCLYCQLGDGAKTTVRRKSFVPVKTVLAEIDKVLRSGTQVDAITFSGSGEPTLHPGLGRLIREIKRRTSLPVIVLTNSSLLTRPSVRKDVAAADIVVPSLDAVRERVFKKINRPHPALSAAGIIAGLVAFRKIYRGRIWLEVLLVKGLNDRPADLRALKKAIARIRPDRVQLNTVVRPPADSSARPLGPKDLEKVRGFLGEKAEIIAKFKKIGRISGTADIPGRVLDFVRRRPETVERIAEALGATPEAVGGVCRQLKKEGMIRSVVHRGRVFFETATDAAKRENPPS